MISLAWYQKPHLAIMDMAGDASPEDIRHATDLLYDWFDNSGQEQVHLIVDQRRLEHLPSLKAITQVRVSPRRGWIILVSPHNKTLEFISTVASHVLQMKVKYVESMTDAVYILRKFVPELENLEELPEIDWAEKIEA